MWFLGEQKGNFRAPIIVSMIGAGYPSAWLRPRIASFRFARQDHCSSAATCRFSTSGLRVTRAEDGRAPHSGNGALPDLSDLWPRASQAHPRMGDYTDGCIVAATIFPLGTVLMGSEPLHRHLTVERISAGAPGRLRYRFRKGVRL